jgi:hypothetical protein
MMILAAKNLKLGAAEHIVLIALQNDGVSKERAETIIRWCKLFNERSEDEPGTREEDLSLPQTQG